MHWCVLLMHVELLKMIYILLWTARCQYLIIFECDMLKFMLCANDWKGIDKDYFIFVFEIFFSKKTKHTQNDHWNFIYLFRSERNEIQSKNSNSDTREETKPYQSSPPCIFLFLFFRCEFSDDLSIVVAPSKAIKYFVYYGLVLNCNKKLIESRP